MPRVRAGIESLIQRGINREIESFFGVPIKCHKIEWHIDNFKRERVVCFYPYGGRQPFTIRDPEHEFPSEAFINRLRLMA